MPSTPASAWFSFLYILGILSISYLKLFIYRKTFTFKISTTESTSAETFQKHTRIFCLFIRFILLSVLDLFTQHSTHKFLVAIIYCLLTCLCVTKVWIKPICFARSNFDCCFHCNWTIIILKTNIFLAMRIARLYVFNKTAFFTCKWPVNAFSRWVLMWPASFLLYFQCTSIPWTQSFTKL